MSHKVDDGNFHIWSPCRFWGDQIFNLMAAKQLSEGKDVIIHTDKIAWSGATMQWHNIDHNILRLWSSISFVKGIVFDITQLDPIQNGCEKSRFYVEQTLAKYWVLKPDFRHNIKENINFDLLERVNYFKDIDPLPKVAVFQPISILHKSKNDILSEYTSPWDKCISALLDLHYEIIVIGSEEDVKNVNEYYPELLTKYPMVNLMGKINMFQAIDLVVNYSDFVLSCDSWAGWYGIASRKKTAVAAGKNFRNNEENTYVTALGNDDIYQLDYAFHKEKCDLNLAEWIHKNA